MNRSVDGEPRYPAMRAEVISALTSLSDPWHQAHRWGKYEEGVNYYDDLDLNVHILYDDCLVLPNPASAVGTILNADEVSAFRELDAVFGPILDELGDRPDMDYLDDPRWSQVVSAAAAALAVMRVSDL